MDREQSVKEITMATTITVRKAEVAELLAAAFPEYRGRMYQVYISESVYVDRIGGGGSRDEIIALYLDHDTGEWRGMRPEASEMKAPCGYIATKPHVIFAVHSTFCGKDTGVTFHVHPSSPYLPKMIAQE
jgi:hypothetical protein